MNKTGLSFGVWGLCLNFAYASSIPTGLWGEKDPSHTREQVRSYYDSGEHKEETVKPFHIYSFSNSENKNFPCSSAINTYQKSKPLETIKNSITEKEKIESYWKEFHENVLERPELKKIKAAGFYPYSTKRAAKGSIFD